MMRSSFRPLAHLVDAAAERWLAVADAPAGERIAVREEIAGSFHIGDRPELTFHGTRYLLCITRHEKGRESAAGELRIDVHRIESGD